MIVGLLRSDSGYAEVAGFVLATLRRSEIARRSGLGERRRLSLAHRPRDAAVLCRLVRTVLREARENLQALSELFDLSPLLDRRCSLLSTGSDNELFSHVR